MGMIKDPTSWRAGFELGLAGFSFPYSKPRRKPTAYLYNGVRLPALPEWDREKYPYAVIFKNIYDNYYTMVASISPCVVTCSVIILGIKHNNLCWGYDNCYLEFRDFIQQDGEFSNRLENLDDTSFVWSNHDIYYADDYQSGYNDGLPVETPDPLAGTLYLAASEPVPIYE